MLLSYKTGSGYQSNQTSLKLSLQSILNFYFVLFLNFKITINVWLQNWKLEAMKTPFENNFVNFCAKNSTDLIKT